MKYPSENTLTVKYFRAYTLYWISKYDLKQNIAAMRLGLKQGQLNELINQKRGISIHHMEKACNNMGINIVDALNTGRELLGEVPSKEPASPFENKAKEAFDFILLHGGEAAEVLIKAVIDLAKKRQDDAESQDLQKTA